jgi:serralysin
MAEENLRRYCVCMSPQKQDVNDRAALLNEARWNLGDEIRVRFLEGETSLKDRVRAVAERWTAPGMANLTFKWVESEPAEIRIAFRQGNGSWSYLGTICRQFPDPNPTMNYGWLTPQSSDDELRRVVLHEFGHALGLIHEHQNPKGGIEWNEPAVKADLSGPPNNWDDATIRSNVLDHYPAKDVTASPVDKLSIMMYPIPKAWTLNNFSSGLNGVLSQDDVNFIKQNYA